MKCLVCKLSEVGEEDSYDKCSVCGRENDSWGVEDDEFGGANYFTINDHKELWKLYGARTWKVKDFNMIDRLACFIQEKFGINERNKSIAEYRRVVEECKELLRQASFDIRADIERRARENPTTPNAIFWLSMNLESK